MHERHSSLKQTALESVNRSLKRGQLIYSTARFSFYYFLLSIKMDTHIFFLSLKWLAYAQTQCFMWIYRSAPNKV